MVDFKNAAVYQIVDPVTGMRYIGSTCEPTLAKRLAKHRTNYKDWFRNGKGYMTSFKILATGREKIELIEKCDVSSRDELRAREEHWIRELDDCVNKIVVGRTNEEYRQLPECKRRALERKRTPEYRARANERKKERYDNDEEYREKILAQQKEHRDTNKARKVNKEWKQQHIRCEVCGNTTTKGSYARHKKSKYCLEAAAAKAEQGL